MAMPIEPFFRVIDWRKPTTILVSACLLMLCSACNFVDPGEKTEVPFGASELRLPIYKAGDFLDYRVSATVSDANQSPVNATGNLTISYSIAAENVVPIDLNPAIDVTKVLKENISLSLGSGYSSERFVYQNQDVRDADYGAMFLIAISNQRTGTDRKLSWAGQNQMLAAQKIMSPVVFANYPGNRGNLPPIDFDLYVDCRDSSSNVLVNCSNAWMYYQEQPQLTNVDNNSFGYFYHEKTYLTAAITKSNWQIGMLTSVAAASTEQFELGYLDTHVLCGGLAGSGAITNGNAQFFYLNQVGPVIMTSVNCTFIAGSGATSRSFTINSAELTDARVGGVPLRNIL